MKKAKVRKVEVFVGTRKGGFLLRSDLKRKNWKVEGPFFAGTEVNCLCRDHRAGKLWAAWLSYQAACSRISVTAASLSVTVIWRFLTGAGNVRAARQQDPSCESQLPKVRSLGLLRR